MKLLFFREPNGNVRLRTNPRANELELFFDQDVQGSAAICRRFLDHVREVETEQLRSWTGSGNAHTVVLTRDGVRLEHDYGTAEPYDMPLSAFASALRQCLEAADTKTLTSEARLAGADNR